MAYRVFKSIGISSAVGKAIDEIVFALNDIDRRLQELEKKDNTNKKTKEGDS